MAKAQARASDRAVDGLALVKLAIRLWPGRQRRSHARKWIAAVRHLRSETKIGWARDRVPSSMLRRKVRTLHRRVGV